jgi:hypothetical protein
MQQKEKNDPVGAIHESPADYAQTKRAIRESPLQHCYF